MSDIYFNYNLKKYLLIYITPIECAFKKLTGIKGSQHEPDMFVNCYRKM